MNRDSIRALAPLLASLAFAGCSATPTDPTGTSSSAIVGGTPVANDTLGTDELLECPAGGNASCTFTYGVASWGCSGNMIADGWFLTAHHCVTQGGEALTGGTAVDPSTIRVQSPSGASWATAVQIFRHPTLDVALVQLNGSIVNGAGAVLTTPIFTGTSASLVGKQVYCQGFGVNLEPAESGFGTLRSAVMTVAGASVGDIFFFPNSGGPYLAPGDSGAPCFLYSPGAGSPNAIVAVNSFEDTLGPGIPPSDNDLVGADGFQSWAASTISTAACESLACGNTTDAFGVTVSCGTCVSGEYCMSNHCCQSGEQWDSVTGNCICEKGLVYSSVENKCIATCNTPACICRANGGEWDGKTCE